MPTPTESARAVLTILGVEVPADQIGRSTGELVGEEEESPGPSAAKATCCPPPPACPSGVDPDLIEEAIEARLDAALFEED
jgi:hypothetical protein